MNLCKICKIVEVSKGTGSPQTCSIECREILRKDIKRKYYLRNKSAVIERSKQARLNGYKPKIKVNTEKRKLYYLKYKEKNLDILRQKARDLAAKPERKEYMRKYRLENREAEKERCKRYYRRSFKVEKNSHLKRKFGITLGKYDEILLAQNQVCAICKRKETRKKKISEDPADLAVDHCHKTGAIRGLLCFKCNSILGKWEDNIETFKTAIEYLSKEGTIKVPDEKGKLAEVVEFCDSGEHLL